MQPMIAARQMFQAYKEIISGERMDFKSFGEAQKYHWNINPQGMIWTHYGSRRFNSRVYKT